MVKTEVSQDKDNLKRAIRKLQQSRRKDKSMLFESKYWKSLYPKLNLQEIKKIIVEVQGKKRAKRVMPSKSKKAVDDMVEKMNEQINDKNRQGAQSLAKMKADNPNVTRKKIKEELEKREVVQVMRKDLKKDQQFAKIWAKRFGGHLQFDLLVFGKGTVSDKTDIGTYNDWITANNKGVGGGKNNKYKYLLTGIDVYSRYAWALPIKAKAGENKNWDADDWGSTSINKLWGALINIYTNRYDGVVGATNMQKADSETVKHLKLKGSAVKVEKRQTKYNKGMVGIDGEKALDPRGKNVNAKKLWGLLGYAVGDEPDRQNLMYPSTIRVAPRGDHAQQGMVESFNRSLRLRINKYFIENDLKEPKFIDPAFRSGKKNEPDGLYWIMKQYNSSKHSAFNNKMSPLEKRGVKLTKKQLDEYKAPNFVPKVPIKIGAYVRVRLPKQGAFEKGTKPVWSKPIFKVKSISKNNQKYILEDLPNKNFLDKKFLGTGFDPKTRGFRYADLQVVKYTSWDKKPIAYKPEKKKIITGKIKQEIKQEFLPQIPVAFTPAKTPLRRSARLAAKKEVKKEPVKKEPVKKKYGRGKRVRKQVKRYGS